MTPQVSIVIPTKDRWDTVGRALRCALSQKDVAVEVLLVDDGSAKPAPRELAGIDDPRVRLLRNVSNQGVARARNRGVQEARGEWVAFLDDDDLWSPAKLAVQLSAVMARRAILAYTGVMWVREEGLVLDAHPAAPPETLAADLRSHNVIGGPSSVLASADAVRRVGGFDPAFAVLADWDLWLRLASSGSAAACSEMLTAYVVHPEAMHFTDMDRARCELSALDAKHRGGGSRIGGYDHRLWAASGYRDSGRRFAAAREFAMLGLRYGDVYQLGRAAGLLLGERAMRRVKPPRSVPRRAAPHWVHAALSLQ